MPKTASPSRKRGGRRRLSDAERAERRERDRKRLEEATRELLTSEGWQRWIRVRRENGLARYSAHNLLMLAMDAGRRGMPLSYVAGYRWWAEHGYQVRKGEKALTVLAPIRRRLENEAGERETRVVGFRGVAVFDRCQVEAGPEAVPLGIEASEPLSGASHSHLRDPLARFAREELDVEVKYGEGLPEGCGGFYKHSEKLIVLRRDEPNAELRTLLHELGHALVGAEREGRDPEDPLRLSYAEEECIVECVGHIVASGAGLDTSSEAIAYCASWGESGSIEIVARAAELIDGLARKLEAVIGDGGPAHGS